MEQNNVVEPSANEVPKVSPFELCVALHAMGFPQKRKFQAMYYITPDKLICIDDLSALKRAGATDFEDLFGELVFKPRLEDIEEESRDFFQDMRWTIRSGIFAYSNVQTGEAGPENPDPYIRAGADNEWEARVRLWLAVTEFKNGPARTLAPEVLDASENKIAGTDSPTNP